MFTDISKTLGLFLWAFTAILFVPLGVCIYYEYFMHTVPHSSFAFIYTIFISASLAILFSWIGREGSTKLLRREGIAVVGFIWLITPALAALPFLLDGTLKNPFQAYFEATSAITTTGASVLNPKRYNAAGVEIPYRQEVKFELTTQYEFYGNITPIRDKEGNIVATGLAALSRGILFWRALMQWLGGVGIVVLFVAILPILGVGGKMLYFSEAGGPIKEGITPRIKETALAILKIYVGLTLLQIFLLVYTNPAIPIFDAICIAFSTLSTGGLSPVDNSIGYYQNSATEWVVIVFMVLGAINFSLYYYVLQGRLYRLKDPELIVFLLILLGSGLFATLVLSGTTSHEGSVYQISDAMRQGIFHMVSASTSTGFSVSDYDYWPYSLQVWMLILMFIGGMAGSTAGGSKVIRQMTLFRVVQNKTEQIFRPDTVRNFRMGGWVVDSSISITILCYFLILIFFSVAGTFLLVLDGVDPETALTSISSLINNAGMAFREAGPTDSFGFLSNFGLTVGSLWMILGRLEFYTLLVMLVPAFWKEV